MGGGDRQAGFSDASMCMVALQRDDDVGNQLNVSFSKQQVIFLV